jgi:hypothetical protein
MHSTPPVLRDKQSPKDILSPLACNRDQGLLQRNEFGVWLTLGEQVRECFLVDMAAFENFYFPVYFPQITY